MRETAFQRWIIHLYKRCNSVVLNLHGHSMQAEGWPDLYVAHKTLECWIELKVASNPCSNVQEVRIKDLRERGVNACVMRLRGEQISIELPHFEAKWYCEKEQLTAANIVQYTTDGLRFLHDAHS